MMPSTVSKRNGILAVMLGIVAISVACDERLAIEVTLQRPAEPDPFADVARLRVHADLDEGVTTFGPVRWDQGPVVLPIVSNPSIRRIAVEGLDDEGRVISSGASQPLDLLGEPPEGPIAIDFTRIGVLSSWPGRIGRREGGRGVSLQGGRWLAVGGVGADGCPREDTAVLGPRREDVNAGPALPGGRTADFAALALGDDRVLVVGGGLVPACPSVEVAPWRLAIGEGGSAAGGPLPWLPRAAVAVLSEGLVLAAGGQGALAASAEVFGLDPRTFTNRAVGALSTPRAGAALVGLGPRRALVLSGQTRTSTDSALTQATVFEPARGATVPGRIELGGQVQAGAAARTPAGSVVALTVDPRRSRSEVRTVVVRPAGEVPLGDTSPVTVATSTEPSTLLALRDGSLLRLGPTSADWIQLLPRQVTPVAMPGRLIGGSIGDGVTLLLDDDGRRHTFNPGPGAVLGWRGPAGALAAQGEARFGVGLVPRRPSRWRLTRDGLEGFAPATDADVGDWVVAVDRMWTDFVLTVEVRGAPSSRAFVLWGAAPDAFVFAEIGSQLRVDRFGGRAPDCAAVDGPATGGAEWSTALRVERDGRRLVISQRRGPALECEDPGTEGWLGLGVSRGTVTFRGVQLSLP